MSKPIVEIKKVLWEVLKQYEPFDNDEKSQKPIRDYTALKNACMRSDLHNAIFTLRAWLETSADTLDELQKSFKSLVQNREQLTQGTAFSLFTHSDSLAWQLYQSFYEILFDKPAFNPTNLQPSEPDTPEILQDFLAVFAPSVTKLLAVELFVKTLPKELDVKLTHTTLATAAELLQARHPTELLVLQNKALDVGSLVLLRNKPDLFRKACYLLEQAHPKYFEHLLKHNPDLTAMISKIRYRDMTLHQAIEMFAFGLRQGGETLTGKKYATSASLSAIVIFKDYLSTLSERQRAIALQLHPMSDEKTTLAYILFDHLDKGKCVEQAATTLDALLNNPANAAILKMLPEGKEEKGIQKKVPTKNVSTRCVNTILALPQEWVKQEIKHIQLADANSLGEFLQNFPGEFYSLFFKEAHFRALINKWQAWALVLVRLQREQCTAFCVEMMSYKDCIKHIQTVENLIAILDYLSSAQCTAIYNVLREHILSRIKSAFDFACIASRLSHEPHTNFYNRMKPTICNFINCANDFVTVCRPLFPEQRNEIYNMVRDKIPAFMNSDQNCRDVFSVLSPVQCGEVCLAALPQIINIYKRGWFEARDQFRIMLSELSFENCKAVCNVLFTQFTDIMGSGKDFDFILCFHRLSTMKRRMIGSALLPRLPDIIKTAEDLGYILNWLSPEQCTELCTALLPRIPTIIKSRRDLFNNVLGCLHAKKRAAVLKVILPTLLAKLPITSDDWSYFREIMPSDDTETIAKEYYQKFREVYLCLTYSETSSVAQSDILTKLDTIMHYRDRLTAIFKRAEKEINSPITFVLSFMGSNLRAAIHYKIRTEQLGTLLLTTSIILNKHRESNPISKTTHSLIQLPLATWVKILDFLLPPNMKLEVDDWQQLAFVTARGMLVKQLEPHAGNQISRFFNLQRKNANTFLSKVKQCQNLTALETVITKDEKSTYENKTLGTVVERWTTRMRG